ncbi:MAG: NAD(P)/FAD-dependent oxidoreductase [Saprospiraceae bacterium]|nr:NAD(P)/FAD-dependent oxidoreductase [Candidatus Vicinibacter affinis]
MKNDFHNVIIIGAGPAGVMAYKYLSRLGVSNILVIEPDKVGGRLNYYKNAYAVGEPNNEGIDTKLLITRDLGLDAEVKKGRVTKVEKNQDKYIINCDPDEKFECFTVIVASGTGPRKLEIDQNEEKILTYKNYPFNEIAESSNILIIGGGHTGFEVAEFLHKQKKCNINILERNEPSLPEARMNFVNSNINIHHFTNVDHIQINFSNSENIFLINCEKANLSDSKFTHIINCTGEQPNTSFLPNEILDNTGRLKISEFENSITCNMSLCWEGMYGIGDITNKPLTGYILYVEGEAIRTSIAVFNFLKSRKIL